MSALPWYGGLMCPLCSGRGKIGDFEFEVEGTNAKEVVAVIRILMRKGLERMGLKSKTEIHLHSSIVGILNTGEIENVQSISVNVANLARNGHEEIARALKELTEAVAMNEGLDSAERAFVLENLEELSRQAALVPEERSKTGVIKSIWLGVASSIGAAGGLAEVWSTWGNTIRTFFGF